MACHDLGLLGAIQQAQRVDIGAGVVHVQQGIAAFVDRRIVFRAVFGILQHVVHAGHLQLQTQPFGHVVSVHAGGGPFIEFHGLVVAAGDERPVAQTLQARGPAVGRGLLCGGRFLLLSAGAALLRSGNLSPLLHTRCAGFAARLAARGAFVLRRSVRSPACGQQQAHR